ncbi:MAG: hemolysin family protein [Candidatus Bipolaricaulota bacterium]
MTAGSQVLVLLILLLFSAFFSGSETAVTSLSELRIRYMIERKPKKRRALEHLLREPNDLIATLLILNNLVNVAASAVATLLFLRVLPPGLPQYVSAMVTTGVMTTALLLVGEITPKTVAKNRAESVTLLVIGPAWRLTRVLLPVVRGLRAVAGVLLKPFGEELLQREEAEVSEDHLITLIEEGEERGTIAAQDGDMIRRVLALDETTAENVMVPRTDMQAIEVNTPLSEIAELVVRDGHSRYPVYEGFHDNVLGLLYAKDLFALMANGDQAKIRDILRPVYYAPTTKPINVLLREFQRERLHLAVVVDEHGGVAGIVTLEDILEEIVGEIEDEYDTPRTGQLLRRLSASEAVVDGDAEVRMVNQTLGLELAGDDAVTIAGLILEELGDIPDPGARIRLGRALLTVEEASEREIISVRIASLPEEGEEEEED